MKSPKRILLGQLASNGDCLYATTVARQIKTDYPDCHLTWAIGSRWRSIIDGNPDVDEVWEIPYYDGPGNLEQWKRFETEAEKRRAQGDFDAIFLVQASPRNFHLWTGGVREAILRAYPHPITVDKAPVVRLSAPEVEKVRQFAEHHHLAEKSTVILFECAPRSTQSMVDPQFALEVAQCIVEKYDDVAVILSSNAPFESPSDNILDGSVLSLRENAELTKVCSLLIGASSGVTWISTSDWAKPLPMIQLVIPDLSRSNSAHYDFHRRGADVSQIIEMHSYSMDTVVSCVEAVRDHGFAAAKSKYHQQTPFKFQRYTDLQYLLMREFRWKQMVKLFKSNVEEHGFKINFVYRLIYLFFKALTIVPRRLFSKAKRTLSRP